MKRQTSISIIHQNNQDNDYDDHQDSKQVKEVEEMETTNSEDKALFPFAGIFAQLLASVLFSFSVLCIKLLPELDGGLHDKTRAMCFRGLFLMSLSGFSMLCKGQTVFVSRNELAIVFARCSFAFLGIYGSYLSLEYINLGDSTAIVYSPIWTSLLGCLLLKEPLKMIQLFAIPTSLLGIILIGHPTLITDLIEFGDSSNLSFAANDHHHHHHQVDTSATSGVVNVSVVIGGGDLYLLDKDDDNDHHHHHLYDFEHRWPGLLLALGSSLAVAFTYISFRVPSSTPIQTTTFWVGTATSVATLGVMCATGFGQAGFWPSDALWYLLMFGNGFFTWIGQALLQYALRYESASLLSVVRTFDVVMTFTLGASILNERVPATSLIGASLIGLVVVSIVSNDLLANWAEQRRVRRKEQQHWSDGTSKENGIVTC